MWLANRAPPLKLKGISVYIDIKLRLYRQIFDQNQNNFKSYITLLDMIEWTKKQSHAAAHFNAEISDGFHESNWIKTH